MPMFTAISVARRNVLLRRDAHLQTGAAAGTRVELHIRVQGAGAPLQAGWAEPQQLEFLERIRAGKSEAVAVVFDRDLQAAGCLFERYGDARRGGVLLHVVQG